MQELVLTTCKICNEEKTSRGFSQHIIKSHGIKLIDYIIKYEFNGIAPTCKCGCSKPVTIRGYKIMDYICGHCASGYFKVGETPDRNKESWLINVAKGIQDYNIASKLNNPEYRKGSNNNFYGKRHTEKTKNIIKERVEAQIANGKHPFIGNLNGRLGKSSLEVKFENYLISKGIEYKHNYKLAFIPEGKTSARYKYYDFYIPALNTLIELHGTFWHPSQLSESLTELQIKNYHNDNFKKELAKLNGYNIKIVYDTELDDYINCFFYILAERADVEKLQVEIDA